MITIEDRLRELPPHIAELALANYNHPRNEDNKSLVATQNWGLWSITGTEAIRQAFTWKHTPEGYFYWEAIYEGKSALFEAGKYYNDDRGALWEIIPVEDYFNGDTSDMPPTAIVIGAPVKDRNSNWMGYARKSAEWQLFECLIFNPGGALSNGTPAQQGEINLLPTPVDYSPIPVIYAWVKPPTSARALILD